MYYVYYKTYIIQIKGIYTHIYTHIYACVFMGFPGGSAVKNLPAMQETPGSGRSPEVGNSNPTPVFLPGKSEGQRNLEGYSPWGHKRVGHDLVTKQQQHTYACVCVCVYIYIYTHTHTEREWEKANIFFSPITQWIILSTWFNTPGWGIALTRSQSWLWLLCRLPSFDLSHRYQLWI